jgi:apolipoprotein N-acyltransferase
MQVSEACASTKTIERVNGRFGAAISYIARTIVVGLLIGLPWLNEMCFPLGLIGYTLLIVDASRVSIRRACLTSFLSGTVALSLAFHWVTQSISDTTHVSFLLAFIVFVVLILWEAVAIGMLGAITRILASFGERWIWLIVPIWVTIQTHWPKVFNWATAHAYLGFPPVLQLAEFAGTPGVTACVLLASVALARLVIQPKNLVAVAEAVFAFTIIGGACSWGVFAIAKWQAKTDSAVKLRVAAVQVDPSFVESLERMRRYSDSVAGEVDVVLWPESTLGNYHESLDHFGEEGYTYDHAEMPNPAINPYPNIHSDLLAGGNTYNDGGRGTGPYKNTVFLINRENRVVGRYVKRSLMPIGEYVPGEKWLPRLRDWAALDTELIRGTCDEPLTLSNGTKAGILVCYEDMVPNNASSSVCGGAECLIALVNGSAFVDSDTLRQHLHLAQLRTIENRRAMIRCAATGVTCLIHPDGRIVEQLPLGEDGLLIVDVPLESGLTFYTRYGDWVSRFNAAISVGLCLVIGYLRVLRRFEGSLVRGQTSPVRL